MEIFRGRLNKDGNDLTITPVFNPLYLEFDLRFGDPIQRGEQVHSLHIALNKDVLNSGMPTQWVIVNQHGHRIAISYNSARDIEVLAFDNDNDAPAGIDILNAEFVLNV